jgi:bacterioferritin-associated ferredoxin
MQHVVRRYPSPRFWLEDSMIVCSCNVLSDAQVRSAVVSEAPRSRVSRVYASLDCTAQCGRCVRTIKVMLEEISRIVTHESRI